MLTLKKKPVDGLKFFGRVRSHLLLLTLSLGLFWGCGATSHIGGQTDTTINVRDSVRWEIRDSIRITEATRYKDLAWLGDSLKIIGIRSRMWAVADTTKGAIIGGLEEGKVEEKIRTVYKDREVLKDTTIYKEVPVEVPGPEKIIKVVPRFWRVTGIIGLISILIGLIYGFVKLKTGGFLKKILKIFKPLG